MRSGSLGGKEAGDARSEGWNWMEMTLCLSLGAPTVDKGPAPSQHRLSAQDSLDLTQSMAAAFQESISQESKRGKEHNI